MENKELVIHKISRMHGVKLIAGSNIENEFTSHFHEDYCIGIVEKGIRKIEFSNTIHLFKKSDIFIINPLEIHSCGTINNKSVSYKVIYINKDFFNSQIYYNENNQHILFKNVIRNNDDLFTEFSNLFSALLTIDNSFETQSVFYSFLNNLISDYAVYKNYSFNDSDKTKTTDIIKTYIDNNCTENISMDLLSCLTGLSQFHLNRKFCRETGMTPHSYLLHKRIEKSKSVLLKTGSIADAALLMGFSDQSHYTKFFKKIIGVTPGKYIRSNKIEKPLNLS